MPRFKNPHATGSTTPGSKRPGRGAGPWSTAVAFSCAGLAVLAIAGCAQLPGNAEGAGQVSPTVEAPVPVIESPEEVAVKVMNLFARPDEPEQRWHAEIRPYLEKEYAIEAEYIDPARIPFDKILSGPVMDGTEHNEQVVTADFKTDAGTWYVELHQNELGGKWLVGGIHELIKQ
ncbi:hypothetical protein OIU93_19475 [Paeniglutamicibacter sp. ZC-3]|uniref:hypothetical protein n=1 Tax=Paeniglutamicibacter sp. ZC-3 TaxID=2986919 RepID=UPI0021F732E5|nr:hypothetical protein [Paeniglutamicibacter sp. ZC-3]MCV9996453.1 hypothetical protein [Paeniglutamicibacter sp. ZC-3]